MQNRIRINRPELCDQPRLREKCICCVSSKKIAVRRLRVDCKKESPRVSRARHGAGERVVWRRSGCALTRYTACTVTIKLIALRAYFLPATSHFCFKNPTKVAPASCAGLCRCLRLCSLPNFLTRAAMPCCAGVCTGLGWRGWLGFHGGRLGRSAPVRGG